MRTQIIVLHRYAYGDSSYIVKALSPDVGVLSLLIKGAKSKKSPFKTAIDPLVHSEVELNYNKYKSASLIIPKEVCLQNYFSKMRSNLQSLASAQFMAEILLKLGNSSFNATEEFNWLLNNFNCLEEDRVNENSISVWLNKLCNILGYAPRLSYCSKCGAELLQGPADLWPAFGGAVCKTCLGAKKSTYDSIFLYELGIFAKENSITEQKEKNSLAKNSWQRIENFFLSHLKTHVGTLENLKSWDFLLEARQLYSN